MRVDAAALVVACFSMSGGACSEARPAAYAVRVSAGIHIVESASPTWGEGEGWRAEGPATFDVGGEDDDELYRLGSARRLPDGRIAIYNGVACEIRLYDAQARLVRAFGRCGDGPGEFRGVIGIRPWAGDSILVVDRRPLRLAIFDRDGVLGRTATVPSVSTLSVPSLQGVLSDGALVVSAMRDPLGRSTPGIDTAQTTLALVRDPSEPPEQLEVLRGAVWDYQAIGGVFTRMRLAFSGNTAVTAATDRIFVGLEDRFEIRVLDGDGVLRGIIRRRHDPVPVRAEDIDWLMQRRLDEVDGAEAEKAVRQAFRDLRHADVMPAFGLPTWPGGAEGGPSVLVDDTGHLWVFSHYRPGAYRNHWSVFTREGVWLGEVLLPDHLVPTQVGADFVLGRWTDELDFVHVRLVPLVRPRAAER